MTPVTKQTMKHWEAVKNLGPVIAKIIINNSTIIA